MVFTSILSFNHYTLERVEWIVSGGIIKIIVTNRNGIPQAQYAVPVPFIRIPSTF